MSDIYNSDYCIEKNLQNELLYRMKIVDSPECPLCNAIPETIERAFVECHKIHILCRQIEVWLGMVLRDNIKIFRFRKIFGAAYKNSTIDTMILLTKINSYKSRQKGKVTNIAEIKYELSVQLQYEQYYAEIEGKLPIFEQKWLGLIQIIG